MSGIPNHMEIPLEKVVLVFEKSYNGTYDVETGILTAMTELIAREPKSQSFPRIRFLLEEHPQETWYGQVNQEELSFGYLNIHLNVTRLNEIYAANPRGWIDTAIGNIRHEFQHLFHQKIYKSVMKKRSSIIRKLYDLFFSHNIGTLKEKELNLFRTQLTRFIHLLHIEGDAEYSQMHFRFIPIYNGSVFGKIENEAFSSALYVKQDIEKYYSAIRTRVNSGLNNTSEEDIMRESTTDFMNKVACYKMGLYMAAVIKMNDDIKKDISDMKDFEFVSAYEKTAKRLDMKTLISISSGNGVLDYNTLLNQWYEVTKSTP